jgi:hypothetical protein
MRQKIIKLDTGKFKINWDDSKYCKEVITLDFNPLIKRFNLAQYPTYTLIHWQARPRGLRRWGCYCGKSDQYYGCDYDKVFFHKGTIELLQLDELQLLNPPSAVVLLANQQLSYDGEIIKCGNL